MNMLTRRHALFAGAATLLAAPLGAAARTVIRPEDFGARGDGRADDADAINAADLKARQSGAVLHFGGTYRVARQLLMSCDWHFDGGRIIRDWIGTHHTGQKDRSATICGRGNDPLASFYTDPGPYRPRGMLRGLSMTGAGDIRMSRAARAHYDLNRDAHATVLYMLCDDFRIGEGMSFALGGNDWCIAFGGDGFVGEPFRIYWQSDAARIYEDGFHVLFGRGGRGWGWRIDSGDDSIAFANNLNLPISDWLIRGPSVFSQCAFGIKIASGRRGATARFGPITVPIEDIRVLQPRWSDPAGRASRNGYVFINSMGEKTGLIRNCEVTGGIFRGRNNGLPFGYDSGVAGVSIAGPVTTSRIEAEVHNPSLWAARMGADRAGGGPRNSLIELDARGPHNWTRVRNVELVDRRGLGAGSAIRMRPRSPG